MYSNKKIIIIHYIIFELNHRTANNHYNFIPDQQLRVRNYYWNNPKNPKHLTKPNITTKLLEAILTPSTILILFSKATNSNMAMARVPQRLFPTNSQIFGRPKNIFTPN